MEKVITATRLARELGDVLGRIRYRGESFVIERNGTPVARLIPMKTVRAGHVIDALRRWREASEREPGFASDLERIGAADREPANPWAS